MEFTALEAEQILELEKLEKLAEIEKFNEIQEIKDWEVRSCYLCSIRKMRCDKTTRPCPNCISRNTHWECLADTLIKRRSCAYCRYSKRGCDKENNPCSRCKERELLCQPVQYIRGKLDSTREDFDNDGNWIRDVLEF
jgi:hypothetical protein